MKKKVLFAAMALVAFAGCSDSEFVGEVNSSPNVSTGSPTEAIVFNSGANAITRSDYTGTAAATMLGNNFVVEGIKWNGGSSTQDVVFNHYNVNYAAGTANTTTSNTAGWEYVAQTPHTYGTTVSPVISAQTIKYWDYAKTQYDFIAFSAGTATALTSGDYSDGKVLFTAIDASKMNGVKTSDVITDGAYKISGKAADLAQVYIADLKTAYRDGETENDAAGDYNQVVQFKFRSLSAKVRVALYETVPGYSVKDVKFYTDASTVPDDGEAHLFTPDGYVFNEEGTYIVYYPTTGSGNVNKTDYNKAHLAFNAAAINGTSTAKTFGAFAASSETATFNDTFAAAEYYEAEGNYLGRASNDATYAGKNTTAGKENYYTIVIPNEEGAVLNLKVNYTLVSTDGSGETISVTGATAQVPAEYASWKSGYAYTYLFKISQNTNGLTNPDITSVEGLYPITFDAVVQNSEVDGIQETITTVATPSITTYTKGKVVTTNNEYVSGNNIYVVVDNNGVQTLTVGANAKLYTVTIESEAAQTINESSVANALKNGTYNSEEGTWTVTDKNGKKLVVTAANGLTAISQIAATDAADGNAITIYGAKFTPSAAGTYVFQYLPVATPAVLYQEGDTDIPDGKQVGDVRTPATYQTADKCNYKIIKVASGS